MPGWIERTTNGNPDQRERDDDTDPGVGDLDAQRREVLADRAVLGEDGRQRNAGDRRRQRKGHIDQCIDEGSSRKFVAHERPRDRRTEHAVDECRQSAAPNDSRYDATARGSSEHVDEIAPSHRGGFHDERRERHQHDGRQKERRSRASTRSQAGSRADERTSRALTAFIRRYRCSGPLTVQMIASTLRFPRSKLDRSTPYLSR